MCFFELWAIIPAAPTVELITPFDAVFILPFQLEYNSITASSSSDEILGYASII